MKVVIQQNVLAKLLAQGGLAALTDEAQGDSTNLAPLIQSVKITVGSNFTVESGVKTILTKCSIPATADNGIEVKEEGEAVVSAKDLTTWVGNQAESKIGLSLAKLDVPESVTPKTEDMEVKGGDVVRKLGTLKISSKDNTKTGSKWQLDSYDPTQMPKARTGAKLNKLFEVEPKNLKMVVDAVSPSAQKNDWEHVYDSVVVQNTSNGLYVGATDTKRCAIYRLETVVEGKGGYFDADGSKLLIPIKTLLATLKVADEAGKFNVEYDDERKAVVVTQGGFEAKIAVPDSKMFGKFPSLDKLLGKKYTDLCTLVKNVMVSRLVTATIVNPESALFAFSNDEVKIYVASDGGKSPSTSTCSVEGLTTAYKVVWGVQHLIDIAKLMKDKSLTIMVPEGDKGSYKIVSKDDPNFVFFAMSPVNPKYDNINID